jgi:hypothetical protein
VRSLTLPSISDSSYGRNLFPKDPGKTRGTNNIQPTHIFQHPTACTRTGAACLLHFSDSKMSHQMDSTTSTAGEPLLRDFLDGFLQLVTAVFLDSVVFFMTLALCVLAPRIFVRIINRIPRWKVGMQAQNDFCMLAAIALAAVHVILSMLFALHDDLGITPDPPSVFWAIIWSTGIIAVWLESSRLRPYSCWSVWKRLGLEMNIVHLSLSFNGETLKHPP